MMALPPSSHHHDKPKSLPTIKGDKAPDTIKGPHTLKEGKRSCPKEEDPRDNREMLEIKANKTIEGCVRTPCSDIFCRLNEAGTIFRRRVHLASVVAPVTRGLNNCYSFRVTTLG